MNHTLNILAGSGIVTLHILSLIIYSDATDTQREYKRWMRRAGVEETWQAYLSRNSFVAHWQRYLMESVVFFGDEMAERDVLFCGISVPLVFDSFEQAIYCPLSTSAAEGVAEQFAGQTGSNFFCVFCWSSAIDFHFFLFAINRNGSAAAADG